MNTNLLPERLLSTRIIDKDHPIVHTTIVRADNAFEYVDRVRADQSILTNIAPPFDRLFVQFHVEGIIDMGIFIQSERIHDVESGIEWRLNASLWANPNIHTNTVGKKPLYWWQIDVAPTGKAKRVEFTRNEDFPPFKVADEIGAKRLICGALFVINLMNCKNVIIEEQPQSKREKRMAVQDAAKGKPTFRYHLLKVRSANKLYDLEGTSGERGEYATHICRGHFKTFTDEAPLLGKHVGTYWWDAHVRGRDKEHAVDKDYEVSV